MTPSARAAAAIEVLDEIAVGERPADRVLGAYLQGRRYIGSKDRRAIQDMVFGTLRRLVLADWWLARRGRPVDARARLIAALALEGDGAALAAAFAPSRYGAAPLDADELALATAIGAGDADAPDWARANVPEWLAGHFAEAFGPNWPAEADALNRQAPVDLRVNTLRTDRAEVMSRLDAMGIAAAPTPIAPDGLRVQGRFASGAALEREGLFSAQDEGSQVIVALAGAAPGMAVLDMCAGAGGKALGLAAAMRNQGELAVWDNDAARLDRLAPRAARAGVTIAAPRVVDATDAPPDAGDGFDIVLVDAPCTGIGMWRRQPDARLRIDERRLNDLVDIQERLLRRAAALVKPGGRLVYAVCSPLSCEGANQVAAVLDAVPDMDAIAIDDLWPTCGLGGTPPREAAPSRGILLSPLRTGTDAFFVAAMSRRGDVEKKGRG